MDQRDVLISRQVALKAAVEVYSAAGGADGPVSDVTVLAEDFAGWILSGAETAQRRVPAGRIVPDRHPNEAVVSHAAANLATGDPGPTPPPDVPYGEDVPTQYNVNAPPDNFRPRPPQAPTCGSGANDTQGCGAEMEYFSGTNSQGKDYSGFRCPNQKKTTDPAEQAAEKIRHPVQWT